MEMLRSRNSLISKVTEKQDFPEVSAPIKGWIRLPETFFLLTAAGCERYKLSQWSATHLIKGHRWSQLSLTHSPPTLQGAPLETFQSYVPAPALDTKDNRKKKTEILYQISLNKASSCFKILEKPPKLFLLEQCVKGRQLMLTYSPPF